MKIPKDVRDRIEAEALNRGSQFLTGNPTTLLSTAGSVTAAVGQITGAGAGAVSGLTNQAANAASAAAVLPIEMAQDVSMYAAARSGEALGRVLSMPSINDVIALSMKYFNERLMNPEEIMKELMVSNEDLIDENEDSANKSKLKNMQEKISKIAGTVSKAAQDCALDAQDKFADAVRYAAEGTAFIEDKLTIAENEAKNYIDSQFEKLVKSTDKHKEKIVDSIAKSIGYAAADKVNAETRRQIQKKLKKVDQNKSKVKISGDALVGKAILNLKATLGL